MSGPSLKYPGAKWRLAEWIVGQLPPHTVYCEPFFGSGAVFFSKGASLGEYLGDVSGDVVNLFSVMRDRPDELIRVVRLTPYARAEYELSWEAADDPLERARRTLVRHWMSVGGNGGGTSRGGWRHTGVVCARTKSVTAEWKRVPERISLHAERLGDAHIENRPALTLLETVNHSATCAYVDPPYLGETRTGKLYANEMMGREEHRALLEFLAHEWRGSAVVSGYAHPLYDELLQGWERRERRAAAEMGQTRTEVLWIRGGAQARLFG